MSNIIATIIFGATLPFICSRCGMVTNFTRILIT